MKFKEKTMNKTVVFTVMISMAMAMSNMLSVDALPQDKQALKKKVNVIRPSFTGGIEEEVKGYLKIDGIKLPRYLRVGPSVDSNFVSDYRTGTPLGLRSSPEGSVFYGVNLINDSLVTQNDRHFLNYDTGTVYKDNQGDVYWNFRKIYRGSSINAGVQIGALDEQINFKPVRQIPNYCQIDEKGVWPRFPKSNSASIAGDKAPSGSSILYSDLFERSGGLGAQIIYRGSDSGQNAVRNAVRNEVNLYGTHLKGEWRFLGINELGGPVSNPSFPSETLAGNSVRPSGENNVADVNYRIYEGPDLGKYNDIYAFGENTNEGRARKITFDRLESKIAPKKNGVRIPKSEYHRYFNIQSPGTQHMAGALKSERVGGTYNSISVPADYVIDLELSSLIIKNDRGEAVYKMSQSTTIDDGVVNRKDEILGGASYLKIQPGKQYSYEYTIRNRSNNTVYNPTVNLLAKTKNLSSVSKNDSSLYIQDPKNYADAYGVFIKGNMGAGESPSVYKNTNGAIGSVPGKDYYTIDGNRKNRVNGKLQVPASTNASIIGPNSSVTMTGRFTFNGAKDEGQINNMYGVTNPNAVQMLIGGKINDKHQVVDRIYESNTLDTVNTSIDDLYRNNNALGSSQWAYSQDLNMGKAHEYVLKNEKNQVVTNGEVLKGKAYSLDVKMYNGSTLWDTAINAKVKYTIKDASSGGVIGTGVKQIGSKIGKNSSKDINIPINVPIKNKTTKIIIEVEVHSDHDSNYDDWYKGNNKFAVAFEARNPVDLRARKAMGSKYDEEVEIKVFSGEQINLQTDISSNSDLVVGPVQVKVVDNNKNGSKISRQEIVNIDENNNHIISYNFKAPKVDPYKEEIFYVDVEVNPADAPDRIDETNYTNNKVRYKVVVSGDINKYGCTSVIENNLLGGKPMGNAVGNPEKIVDENFSTFMSKITVRRRDKVQVLDKDSGEYVTKWGEWYPYQLELRELTNMMTLPNKGKDAVKESHRIESVMFKSKFTTDRRSEGKDFDIINENGFVDILQHPKYARVKAGYGFEINVKTSYSTNIDEVYKKYTSSGMDTKMNNGKSVYSNTVDKLNKLKSLRDDIDFKMDKNSMSVKFVPEPKTVTINAKDEVICLIMPDGRKYSTLDKNKKLIEQSNRVQGQPNNPYDTSEKVEWNYKLTNRKYGKEGYSRKYYVSNETQDTIMPSASQPEGKRYYMRIGTNRLGLGGLVYANDVPGSNSVFDVKDIEIIIYGGKYDDLKDGQL